MKPHEETWRVLIVDGKARYVCRGQCATQERPDFDARTPKAAKLAAMAPAMARLLLDLRTSIDLDPSRAPEIEKPLCAAGVLP